MFYADYRLPEIGKGHSGQDTLIAELMHNTPHAEHARYYAEKVRRAAIRRRLIHDAKELTRLAYDDHVPDDELVAELAATIERGCRLRPSPEVPRWPKFKWVHGALQNVGHRTRVVRTLDALGEADRDCDLVLFCQKGGGLCQNAIADRGRRKLARWVGWTFDLVAIERLPLAEQSGFSRAWRRELAAMDVAYVKERDHLDQYRDLGIRAR